MIGADEWEGIKQLFKEGLSAPKIAEKFTKSLTTVYRIIKSKESKPEPKEKIKVPKKLVNFENYLNKRIKDGVSNGIKLFQELKVRGYHGSYPSLNRYLKELSRKKANQYKPAIRVETGLGEQAQVDWGSFGKIEARGKLERLYGFVYVLGFSRAMYVEFTIKQNLATLIQCHLNAFNQLGIPRSILYDNVKTVVLRREKLPDGKYKFHYNPTFLDFSEHFGFQINLSPPYWPRSKGKVESGVKYVKYNFLQGLDIRKEKLSLTHLNQKVNSWINQIADTRKHGTTNKKPIEVWHKEKRHLRFPREFPPYTISPLLERNSTKDALIQYKFNFYSVPLNFARRKLYVKETNKNGISELEIYHEDTLIATHTIISGRGKWSVKDEHLLRVDEKVELSKNTSPQIKSSPKEALKNVVDFSRPKGYYDQLIPKGGKWLTK